MNASKTKYMLVGGTERDRTSLGSNVKIDGDTFEVVEEFVYLGSLLTADNNVSREIRRCITTQVTILILFGFICFYNSFIGTLHILVNLIEVSAEYNYSSSIFGFKNTSKNT